MGEPVLVDDIASDPRFNKANDPQYGNGSFICMPIRVGDRVIGVINMAKRRDGVVSDALRPPPFSSTDLQFLNALMTYIGYAVDNSRLLEEAQSSASQLQNVVDDLKSTQGQLVRGETLRAMGQLSSGMAHHLNNLFAVILGRVELMMGKVQEAGHAALPRDHPAHRPGRRGGGAARAAVQPRAAGLRRGGGSQPARAGGGRAHAAALARRGAAARQPHRGGGGGGGHRGGLGRAGAASRGPDEPAAQRRRRHHPGGRPHHAQDVGQGRSRLLLGHRHRRGHARGSAAPGARALLHHQGTQGHRAGAQRGLRHRAALRRDPDAREHGRAGHHLEVSLPTASRRPRSPRRARTRTRRPRCRCASW